MLLHIHHETEFQYASPVSDSYMEARLRPWSDAEQGCADYFLTTSPGARISHCRTPFAWVEFFNLLAPHDTLRLTSEATVIAMPRNPFEQLDLVSPDWPLLQEPGLRGRLWEYTQPPPEPDVAAAAGQLAAELRRGTGPGVTAFLQELTRHIHEGYTYDPRATQVTTPLVEVLAHRRGVCQDFAHLMLAVARSAGVPARYVSGYLHVESSLEPGGRGGAGGGAMHAWVEGYVPASGWVGFDPTHGLLVDHHYVKVGVGRAYSDVPPTRGVFRGPREHAMAVRVRVTAAEADVRRQAPDARSTEMSATHSDRRPGPTVTGGSPAPSDPWRARAGVRQRTPRLASGV
jgi:transglutaminase-like putative cysteine protease